jgi:hypothetical protein
MRGPRSESEHPICALPGCGQEVPILRGGKRPRYHSALCRAEAQDLEAARREFAASAAATSPALTMPPATGGRRGIVATVAIAGVLAASGAAVALWPEDEGYRLSPIAATDLRQDETSDPPVESTGQPVPSNTAPAPVKPRPVPPAPPRTQPPAASTTKPPARTTTPSQGPKVRFGFDRGLQGWEVFWDEQNLDVGATSSPVFAGSGALWMELVADGFAAVGVDTSALRAGTTVSYYVYSDGSGDGTVQPFLFDEDGEIYFPVDARELPTKAGYFRLTFKVPNIKVASIGLEVFAFAGGLQVGLDSVTW